MENTTTQMDAERGERLRAELKRLGIRQSDFASEIGMGQVTVSRWVTGKQPPPPIVWAYLRLRGGIHAAFFDLAPDRSRKRRQETKREET